MLQNTEALDITTEELPSQLLQQATTDLTEDEQEIKKLYVEDLEERIQQKAEARRNLDNAELNLLETSEMAKQALDQGYSLRSNISELSRRDPKYSYQKVKQLRHDIAKTYSAEQGVIDFFKKRELEKEKPEIIAPDVANQRLKEEGFDIKFDKPITEGAYEYALMKARAERDMLQELAFYEETNDFSALQNACLMASSISGSVGAIETIGTAALSMAGGIGIARGLSSLGLALGKASKISKAAKIARQMMLAEKNAIAHANMIDRLTKGIRNMSFGEKLVYDTTRMGLGAIGQRASLATTMIPFAMDGILTELPGTFLRDYANRIAPSADYNSSKFITANLLTAGSIGAALPGIGTALNKVPTVVDNVWESINKLINKKFDKTINTETLRNNEIAAKEAQAAKETVTGAFKKATEIAQDDLKISNEIVMNSMAIAGENVNEDEFHLLITVLEDALRQGKPLSVIEDLPIFHRFCSKVPGMYDLLQSLAKEKATAGDFVKALQERGINLQYNKKSASLKLTDMTTESITAYLDDIKNNGLGIGVKIANETGMLGKHFLYALDEQEALVNLYKHYVYNMVDDTPELLEQISIPLQMEVIESQKKLLTIQHKLRDILETYKLIYEANTAAKKHESWGVPYPIKTQKRMYALKDGSYGSLRDSVKELAALLLPDSWNKQITEIKSLLQKQIDNTDLTGKGILDSTQELEANKKLALYNEYINKFADMILDDERQAVGDALRIYKGSSRTSFLEALEEELTEGIENNKELLNTFETFKKQFEDPKEILKKLKFGKDIPEIGYVYKPNIQTSKTIKEYMSNQTNIVERNQVAKAGFLSKQNTEAGTVLTKALQRFQDDYMAGAVPVNKNYMFSVTRQLETTEAIIQGDFHLFSSTLLNKLKQMPDAIDFEILKSGAYSLKDLLDNLSSKAFRDTIKETLQETMLQGIPTASIQKELDSIIDDSLVSATAQKDINKTVIDVGKRVLKTEGETEVSEEIKDLADILMQEQLDKVLIPLYQELTVRAINHQTVLYNQLNLALDLIQRCLKTPGKISEIIMGDISTTPIPVEGSAISIESLGDIAGDYRNWEIDLDNQGPDILAFAKDPDNNLAIQEAMLYKRQSIIEGLTDKEGVHWSANDNAGRVALVFTDKVADLFQKLFDAGSNKTFDFTIMHPSKLANMEYLLPEDTLQKSLLARVCNDINQFLNTSPITKEFTKLTGDTVMLAKRNAGIHLFEVADLDRHIAPVFDKFNISLNRFRDLLLNKDFISLDQLRKTFAENIRSKKIKITDAMIDQAIADRMDKIAIGLMGDGHTELGLVERLKRGSGALNVDLRYQSPKYLEDLNRPLYYKSLDAEKEDLKHFAYDSLKEVVTANFTNLKKSYAILKKCGPEPFSYYDSIVDTMTNYVVNEAPAKYSLEQVERMKNSLGRSTFRSARNHALNMLCGTYHNPSSNGIRWMQLMGRMITSPMLMKAGFKSITDYGYQFQGLVTHGLMSSTSLKDRQQILNNALSAFTKKEIVQALHVNQALKNDTLQQMLYNSSFAQGSGQQLNKATSKLNSFAPTILKAESFQRGFSDFMLNKMAFIEPLTNYNRANAALSIMETMGAHSVNKFDTLNARLQTFLTRHNINAYEWDNIFTKDFIANTNDILKKQYGDDLGDLTDKKMFLPELGREISDAAISKHLQKQGLEINATAIRLYRQNLLDKAQVLVNTSANELTSIPSVRIQGMLSLYSNPNDWIGAIAGIITQFQSFGVAVNFYHWGRRLATHMDPKNPLFNNFLACALGSPSTAIDMAGFIAEMAIFQGLINELLGNLTGTNKSIINEDSEVQWDIVADKISRAIVDQSGALGMALDTIVSVFSTGSGKGGGISIPIAPSASHVLRQAGTVFDALTRESTEGQRGKALAGALLQNTGENLGIAKHPCTQALWQVIIGDKLTEWQQGENYYRYLKQRESNGYRPSWVHNISNSIYDRFTDF